MYSPTVKIRQRILRRDQEEMLLLVEDMRRTLLAEDTNKALPIEDVSALG